MTAPGVSLHQQLAALAQAAQRVPGISAVAIYRCDAACQEAQLTAFASSALEDPSLPTQVTIARHPSFQQVLQTGNSLIMDYTALMQDLRVAADQPLEQPALAGASVHLHPLTQTGKPIGILCFILDPEQTTGALPPVLAALAVTADQIMSTAADLEQAARRSADMALVQRIAGTLVAHLELDQTLQQITVGVRDLLQADRATLWLYHEAEGLLERRSTIGLPHPGGPPPLGERVPAGATVHALAIRQGEVLLLEDVTTDPRVTPAWRERTRNNGVVSLLVIPLLFEGRALGSLGISSMARRSYSPDQIALAQTLALFIAVALHNAHIYDQAARRARELEALHRISRTVVSRLEMPAVLQEIVRAAQEAVQADRTTLWLYHAEESVIELQAVSGLHAEVDNQVHGRRVPVTAETTRRVIAERRIVALTDAVPPVDGSEERRKELDSLGLRSVLLVPVLDDDTVLGVMGFTYLRPNEFPQQLQDVAQTIANHAAAAIVNARLYHRATRRAQELELLNVISTRLAANLELGTALQSIAEAASELFQADGVVIWGVRDGTHLDAQVRSGLGAHLVVPPIALAEQERPVAVAFRSRTTVFIPDFTTSMLRPLYYRELHAAGVNAVVHIPMLDQNQPLGVITLNYAVAPVLTEDRRALMEELASRAAAAIASARRFQEVSLLASRDGLTGLLNHREFHLRLQEELARAQWNHTPVSLVMVDLDDFKQVNDRFGHQQGDRVLRDTAALLQGEVRVSDTVARYGGEEFAIILPGATKDVAARIADRMRWALEQCHFAVGMASAAGLTASLGVASYPEDGEQSDALLAAADQALYTAKRAGKNRVVASADRQNGAR